ncbi:MAG TPA: S-layer homology domain-containing protein [Leptolyngbyaceae cyanobacterium M65_K2018_010]|nr:S-layer homology domain-containing protein [Leptolyngbyaceae cyanobacterium M65_K2018_010]
MAGKGWTRVGLGVVIGLAGAAAIAPAWAEPVPPAGPAHVADGGAEGQRILPFTDVPTDHWAYQALLNLAGVYGCLSGYPDHRFRGDQSLTRFEFAAGLEACLKVVNTMIQTRQSLSSQTADQLLESLDQSLQELRRLNESVPETP